MYLPGGPCDLVTTSNWEYNLTNNCISPFRRLTSRVRGPVTSGY